MYVYPDFHTKYTLWKKSKPIQRESPSGNILECYNPLPDRNNGMGRLDNTYTCAISRDGRDIRTEKSIRKLDSMWDNRRYMALKEFIDAHHPYFYTDLIRKQGIPAISSGDISSLEKP